MTKVPVNIPNILTLFRFILIIPAAVFALNEEYFIALIIFLVACITDLLDGAIARKYNMISEAGILLDPLADKCMAVAMTVVFVINGVFPVWVAVLIFLKEATMIIGGIILYTKKLITPANKIGKIAAFSFNVALGLAFLNQYINPYYLWFMYLSLFLMIIALIQYTYFNWYKKYILAKRG